MHLDLVTDTRSSTELFTPVQGCFWNYSKKWGVDAMSRLRRRLIKSNAPSVVQDSLVDPLEALSMEDLDGRSCSKRVAAHGYLWGANLSLPGLLFHAIEPARRGSKSPAFARHRSETALSACSNSIDNVICLFDLSKKHFNLRRP